MYRKHIQAGVSRLERIQDDFPKFGDKKDDSLLDSGKRIKLVQDSIVVNKNLRDGSTDVVSKFEWFHPSRIIASRMLMEEGPGDSLYDKKTLYIPPDGFKKMSASQKQY